MQIWLHANLFRFLLSKLFWLLVGVLAMPVKIRRCSKCIRASFPKGFCGCALNYFISINFKKSNISSPNFYFLFCSFELAAWLKPQKKYSVDLLNSTWNGEATRSETGSSRSSFPARVESSSSLSRKATRVATWLGQSPVPRVPKNGWKSSIFPNKTWLGQVFDRSWGLPHGTKT